MNNADQTTGSFEDEKYKASGLSVREEALLSRFHDGEVTFFGNFFARRLLAKKPEARDFLDQMREVSQAVDSAISSSMNLGGSGSAGPDLWEKISARIEVEERSAVLLGTRRDIQAGSKESVAWLERLGWGMSGALATACLAFVVVQLQPESGVGPNMLSLPKANPGVLLPTSSSPRTLSPRAMASQPVTVREVSSSPSSSYRGLQREQDFSGPPVPIRANDNLVEVDWMRSNGRVRMIQDPSRRSAIIWVKKRSGSGYPGAVPSIRTPLTFSLDDQRGRDNDPLVIYNQKLPESLPVSNK